MQVSIRQAKGVDYEKIAGLLSSSSLPSEGFAEHLHNFLVAENGDGIVGAIGLEIYGETALLRSAVVSSPLQYKGVGTLLYNQLIENAKSLGVRRLILLTTTAEKYFERKGWKRIDAKSVSGAVTTSVEFTGACPSTAACMELSLHSERSEAE